MEDQPFPEIPFAELELRGTLAGGLTYNQGTLERLCEAWGVRPVLFEQPGLFARLVLHWYAAALDRGEPRCPHMEAMLQSAEAEGRQQN